MIDAILWSTGLIVWVLFAIYVGPLVPTIVGLVCATLTYRPASWLDDRYYDGEDDVEQAREEGRWYYYATHYLFHTAESFRRGIDLYLDWLEPYYGRLPGDI